MNKNDLIDLINKYTFYVKQANKILIEYYNISISPLLAYRNKQIPKVGAFNFGELEFAFEFHGKGCKARINDIIIDFDYQIPTYEYLGFDQWKLIQFLVDNGFKSFSNRAQKHEFLKELEALLEQGFLIVSTDHKISEKFKIRINKGSGYDFKINPNFKK